ncbi:class I SAM-dependent methyltransferase [Halobacillus rhizosphaerae]|uniref:class I SAM-dependent DNA methyltransferase n=1 Tax=Halobacillus rhizosphaerae TaxID=3064889 RepID=UPI00398BACED
MAEVYDQLMADAPYSEWVSLTQKIINQYHPDIQSILDLGCGTGEITCRLSEAGFQLTGVDLSEEMLSLAAQKSPGTKINWLHQDIRELKGLENFDCIVSFCDVLNYITTEEDLQRVFKNAYHSLTDSGLFIFDVHSLHHIQDHLLGETFAEVYDDISYIWLCDPGDMNDTVVHDLTFFLQSEDVYERFDEQHVQRGYSVSEIERQITSAGFQLLNICSDFKLDGSRDGDRLFFICQK